MNGSKEGTGSIIAFKYFVNEGNLSYPHTFITSILLKY